MSLATEHRKLAFWVANQFNAPDRAGIESAASYGLVRAEADFDPDRGSFHALAVLTCRHAVIREVLRQRREAEREEPLFYVDDDGEEDERRDLPHVPPADVELSLMTDRLLEELAGLEPRAREILTRRYGLDGPEETLTAIAAGMGLSRSRVAQIEARALRSLRRALSRRRR